MDYMQSSAPFHLMNPAALSFREPRRVLAANLTDLSESLSDEVQCGSVANKEDISLARRLLAEPFQTPHHGFLGNRISTFFGQHRAGPSGTRNGSATSQDLQFDFSDNGSQNGQSAKRNPFRLHVAKAQRQSKRQVPLHQQSKQQDEVTSVTRGQSFDSLPRLQSAAHEARSESSQAGTSSSSSIMQAETGTGSRNKPRGQNFGDAHSTQADPYSLASSRSSPSQGEGDAYTKLDHSSTVIQRSEHFKITFGDESISPAHTEERCFSWDINPSLSEGQELMGFGGDLGKKRLHISSESRNPLPPGFTDGTGEIGRPSVPYIIGFEKQVLALLVLVLGEPWQRLIIRALDSEPLIHDAFFTLSGDKHTFYPSDSPPPKRILDIGTGTGV